MSIDQRLALRASAAIHEALAEANRLATSFELPDTAWQHCQRLSRQAQTADRRGWHRAVARLQEELRYGVSDLHRQLDSILLRLDDPGTQAETARQHEIFRDLVALEGEFDEVDLSLKECMVSAVTEAIVLEDIDLGRFKIELHWDELGQYQPYSAIALDPNPAASNPDTTHPHVQDNRLCEGAGRTAIREALHQGRLLDFFLVVRQILQTYNPRSPHVSLDQWHGVDCHDCGRLIAGDDRDVCERCDVDLCSDCSTTCGGCDRRLCSECMSTCSDCGASFCSKCLSPCSGCRQEFCEECLSDEKCTACLEAEEEEEEAEAERLLPTLRFTPYAWAKLLFLRDLGETEVGGFGISAPDDLLLIEDVRLVRQCCTSFTVCFDDAAVADYFDDEVDQGRRPERFARTWVHTHPGNSPIPSSTDEATFRRSFGGPDWAVMFVLARGGQTYARLRFNVGPGGSLEIPVQVDFRRPFLAADHAAWKAEYTANVQVAQYAPWQDRDEPLALSDDWETTLTGTS